MRDLRPNSRDEPKIMKQSSLKINEIFYSIQGEASQSGMPCVFVRLSGCPLRCRWCDTEYAFHEGERLGFEQILEKIKSYGCRLVEITGGEPLAQPACLPFMELLEKEGFDLMLETSGAYCVKNVPSKVKIIMDLKAPGSGEQNKNRYENLQYLCPEKDELKIVVSDRGDFEYACDLWSRPEMKLSLIHI